MALRRLTRDAMPSDTVVNTSTDCHASPDKTEESHVAPLSCRSPRDREFKHSLRMIFGAFDANSKVVRDSLYRIRILSKDTYP